MRRNTKRPEEGYIRGKVRKRRQEREGGRQRFRKEVILTNLANLDPLITVAM